MWFHYGVEGHDAQLMQTWLTIEQHDIIIDQMAFDNISVLQLLSYFVSIAVLEKLFDVCTALQKEVGARMHVGPGYDQFS